MANTFPVREDNISAVTYIASTVLAQYRAVKLAATQGEVEYSTNADRAIGITQRDADTVGEHIAIKTDGYTLVTTGAAVAIGAELTSGTDGKLVTATAGQIVVALATQASTADGEIVEAKLVTPYAAA